MSPIALVLLGVNCFLAGWLASWYVFDKMFYQPKSKMLKEVLDTSLKHNQSMIDFLDSLMPKKNADGSMVSPIQIKKEE